MKSKVLITIGFVMILVAVLLGACTDNAKKERDDDSSNNKVKEVSYEILDDSVELDKEIVDWKKKNVLKEGFFVQKTKSETFVLISGGKQTTTGFGISLNDVKQKGNKVTIEYEVVKPAVGDTVEQKQTNPHMVLRVASKDVEVLGKIAPLELQKPEKNEKSSEDDKNKENNK